jgi:hypothetical protein
MPSLAKVIGCHLSAPLGTSLVNAAAVAFSQRAAVRTVRHANFAIWSMNALHDAEQRNWQQQMHQ